MQVLARGTYGTGESLDSAGCSEVKTNSGVSILERCERKSGRHGATPALEGVVEAVDIVRAIRRRRVLAEEAIVNISINWPFRDVLSVVPLDLFLPSRMLKNKRELWIEIHDVDKGKREAEAASCTTNHSRVLQTHLHRAGFSS